MIYIIFILYQNKVNILLYIKHNLPFKIKNKEQTQNIKTKGVEDDG